MQKYICVKSMDTTDCGAACLASVAKYFGRTISITKIREIAGTDKMGTNVYGMVKAAEQIGFSTKAVKGTKDAIFTNFPLPAIAHVVVEGNLMHYVVLYKITKTTITIADPTKGVIRKPIEEFLKSWLGYLILLTPSSKFEKSNDSKSIVKRFSSLLLPQRKLILDIFIGSLLLTFLGIVSALYFQVIIDDILPLRLVDTLITISLFALFIKVLCALLSFSRTQLILHLSQKLDISLLLGYYNHVLQLPMRFFSSRKIGEIISRFQDASSIRDALSRATLTVMIDTLMAVVGGIVIYLKSSKLFVISLLMVLLYALLVFIFNKPYKSANEQQMEDNAQLTAYLVESLNGIQTIKSVNGERFTQFETEKKFIKLLKSIFKLSYITNIQDVLKTLIEGIGGILIIWFGANSVLNNEMTVGGLVAFNALLAFFLDPIKNLIDLQPTMQTAFVASDRLGEVLDLDIEKNNEQKKIAPKSLYGDILIHDISFRYGKRQLVLDQFSMKIDAGQRVAIVGESGAGKTTVAKLLLNFYQCEKGSISIGDYSIEDIQLSALREKIAYIPQEAFLFSGTIWDNIVFGADNPQAEDVIRCAKMAQVHEFICSLPMRYNTHIDENGSNLSGGQRQRIAIARAILKHPQILILDEATSNLDAITEKAIQDTIEIFSKGITTIIIAHRLSTIRRCDKIFVMEKGKIIECGNHQQLMSKENGYYRALFHAQSEE